MARQHRPRPRTTPAGQSTTRLDGAPVRVNDTAVTGFADAATETGIDQLSHLSSIRELRNQIGAAGLRQAAIDAGRRPPSDRTLRRWVHDGRIPHASVASNAQRRAAIDRLGGVQAVAAIVGRSPSSVSRWQAGKTNQLRGAANRKLADARVTETLARAGIIDRAGHQRRAKVVVQATVHARSGDAAGYDYRQKKVMSFDGVGGDLLNETDSRMLADAIARGDHAAAVAVLERHASLNYANFDAFSDIDGMHFDSIESITLEWQ
jgi:DNA-binding transcriptional regulator YdaS (Cro superfamily)